MTPMYLDEVIDEVVRAARVIASTKDVLIDPLTIRSATFTGDEDLIRRMITNLIDNAVRHAPAGTTVRIDLDAAETGYVIAVKDQGSGISPETRAHLFECFYRGDPARRGGVHDGAGLGLALARWIASVHGGNVVLARSSQSGSTFEISLPFRC